MSFVIGSVLFLLGGFFGMLLMAFATTLPRKHEEQLEEITTMLRLVGDDES